jgi:molybdenum cofactor biosynthesis protein B
MGATDHREDAAKQASARCAILTVTDSKTRQTDSSGSAASEIFVKFGHTVVLHEIVPNDRVRIADAAGEALLKADLVVTIGGTGASRKDISVESVRPLIQKELPGFGELFRSMSAKEIGSAAILSRATLGVGAEGKILLCLPGSENAVRLGLEGILMNELKHLLRELRRHA